MRSLAKNLFLLLAVLSAGVLLASFPVAGGYESKAVLVQRVEKDDAAAGLFGEGPEYRLIGSPQKLIVTDRSLLFEKDGQTMLDEAALKEKGLYPLQLRTVQFVVSLARMGSGIVFIVSMAAYLLLRRSKKPGGLQAANTA